MRARCPACVHSGGAGPSRRAVGRVRALAPHATRANTHSAVILSLFAQVTQSAPRVVSGETVIIPALGAETAATEARDKTTVTAVPARRAPLGMASRPALKHPGLPEGRRGLAALPLAVLAQGSPGQVRRLPSTRPCGGSSGWFLPCERPPCTGRRIEGCGGPQGKERRVPRSQAPGGVGAAGLGEAAQSTKGGWNLWPASQPRACGRGRVSAEAGREHAQ